MEADAHQLLDEWLDRERERQGYPGTAVAIVVRDSVAFMGGYGVADLETRAPVDTDTLFSLASISKVVTAMAALLLHQDGALDLDADLNQYLSPVRVANPHHPHTPLTARQLLQHRSSLNDTEEGLHTWQVQGDSPVTLDEQVRRHLMVGGEFFREAEWSAAAPGEAAYHYSNAGFTLLGYLVERVARQPFEAFTRARIFEPLQLRSAAWHLRAVPAGAARNVANVYRGGGGAEGGALAACGYYGVPEWPACQLRMSLADVAALLRVFVRLSIPPPPPSSPSSPSPSAAPELLSRESYAAMCPASFQGGLAWWGKDAWYGYKDEEVWVHGGFMDGVRTQVNFYPALHAGLVILCNGEGGCYKAIEQRLLNELRECVRRAGDL